MARRRRSAAAKPRRSRKKIASPDEGQDIIVLFADVVGCSQISNHKSIKEYYDIIKTFQDCFNRVCKFYKEDTYEKHEYPLFQYEPRGDEGCLKIFVSRSSDLIARDIDVAISIALDLKRMWLLAPYNRERILNDRLLPADIAVGINSGKVCIKDNQPEGYAINLAKRIESASRDGKFYHVLVSESAHGQLYYLKDESVYKFDNPFNISTKGISHAIKAFEIKHHFLSTDWYDALPDDLSDISMVYPELVQPETLQIIKTAYEINPTNLWLAEEYINISMMDAYRKLRLQNKQDDINARKREYTPVLEIAQRIANSDLKDATLLATWGFILGELERYEEEEKRYKEAISHDEQDGEIHWYLALCISYQLDEARKEVTNLEDFYHQHEKRIRKVLEEFMRASELKPMNPWIVYDYACELSWWSQVEKKFKKTAVEMLINAFKLNAELKEWAKDDEYLAPIIGDSSVKQYLK